MSAPFFSVGGVVTQRCLAAAALAGVSVWWLLRHRHQANAYACSREEQLPVWDEHPVIPLWPSGQVPAAVAAEDTGHEDWGIFNREKAWAASHKLGAFLYESRHLPALKAILPQKSQHPRAAVIVCAGGGYHQLSPAECGGIVAFFHRLGIVCYVLRYRLMPEYHFSLAPLLDLQRAIRVVHSRASQDGVDTDRIGLCGISAGGHLVASAAAILTRDFPDAKLNPVRHGYTDAIDKLGCRLAFAVLFAGGYTTWTTPHNPSAINAMGASPLHGTPLDNVHSRMPPMFIAHSTDDGVLDCGRHCDAFVARLHEMGSMDLELVREDMGGHCEGGITRAWGEPLVAWLCRRGYVGPLPANGKQGVGFDYELWRKPGPCPRSWYLSSGVALCGQSQARAS